ncbi:MAG: ankyrin repeat domain-containing protein [Spirochaetes bacterium]|nr:ankyrin repeat domain-containing protein [Spirochaetota bacterium]
MAILRVFLVIFICVGLGLGIKSVFELYKSWISIHGKEVRCVDGEITGYYVKTDIIEHGSSPVEYLSWFPQPQFRYKSNIGWVKQTDKNVQLFKSFKEGQKVKVALPPYGGAVVIDFHTRYFFWGLVFIISLLFIFLPILVLPMVKAPQLEFFNKPVFENLPFKPKHFLYVILALFAFTAFMASKDFIYQIMPRGKGGELIKALNNNNRESVYILIEKGANVNAKEKYTKLSVLMIAIRDDKKWIIDVLLKRGARVNDEDSVGRTPLYYAVKAKNADAVEKLIKRKVKFECTFDDILILAIAQKDSKTARLLIEGGHPVKNKHKEHGITAGDFAILAGLPDIVKLIYQKKGLFTAPDIFVTIANEEKSRIDTLIKSGGIRHIKFGKMTLENWIKLCKNK